jgi:hypothetical protein
LSKNLAWRGDLIRRSFGNLGDVVSAFLQAGEEKVA